MYLKKLIVFIMIVIECKSTMNENCPNVRSDLGFVRKRRNLAFSEGSNFILRPSVLVTLMTHAPSGWNLVLEMDLLFPLPDAKFIAAHLRRKLHHRQKRDIWERFQKALEMYNLNGMLCVLKSICEAKLYLAPRGKSLVHDILRAIFTHNLNGEACILKSICEANLYLSPPGKSLVHDELRAIFTAPILEQEFVEEIRGSYDKLLDPDFCDNLSGCPLSLLHFIPPLK